MKITMSVILAISLFLLASSYATFPDNNKLKSRSVRYVVFLFGTSSVERVIQSITSFGSVTITTPYDTILVYPSEDNQLFMTAYICTFHDEAMDVLDSSSSDVFFLFNSFKSALGFDPNFLAVTMYVEVVEGSLAESNFRKFTLFMLDAHIGIVNDDNSLHAWTLEEIRTNSIRNGFRFFQCSEKKQ